MRRLRIGLCFDPRFPQRPAAARRAGRFDLLIFPELLDGGYAALEAGRGEHRLHDGFLEGFARLTRAAGVICVAGSVLLKDNKGNRHNTSLVFRSGNVIHQYEKIHLFRPAGDHRHFSPGRSCLPFTLRYRGGTLRAGLIICYDLRFPEIARSLALRGIQILLVPARWPRVRDEAWRTLLRARAMENQIFVVGCNARGSEGGNSYVVDPMGREIFSSRGRTRRLLELVQIDPGRIARAKIRHRNIADARLLHRIRFPRGFSGTPGGAGRKRRSASG
jgi:predicted amidohydrolase